MNFNKNDKVKIISGGKPFEGMIGTILDSNRNEVKVKLTLNKDQENQRILTNIFNKNAVELITTENFLNENKKGVYNMENKNKTLTLEELKAWCSDNDAEFIIENFGDNVAIIKDLYNEELGTYDLTTNELILNEDVEPESDDVNIAPKAEDDFIHDYVFNVNIDDDSDELPSWEFLSKIASAENLDDSTVFERACELGYKLYEIVAPNFNKLVVAAKKITKDDIYNDFADYLEGNAKVNELKK